MLPGLLCEEQTIGWTRESAGAGGFGGLSGAMVEVWPLAGVSRRLAFLGSEGINLSSSEDDEELEVWLGIVSMKVFECVELL